MSNPAHQTQLPPDEARRLRAINAGVAALKKSKFRLRYDRISAIVGPVLFVLYLISPTLALAILGRRERRLQTKADRAQRKASAAYSGWCWLETVHANEKKARRNALEPATATPTGEDG